jgi:hypothetical protein
MVLLYMRWEKCFIVHKTTMIKIINQKDLISKVL